MKFEEPNGATPLEKDEMEGLLHSHITTRDELNELEQANIIDGLMWLKRRRKPDRLNEAFIRLVHQKLFGEVWGWAGSYRQTEKNIGIDPLQIPMQVQQLCDDAVAWVEYSSYPPKAAAARLHHRMVQIHPFPNGNGRHARVIADWFLKESYGLPPLNWGGPALLLGNGIERSTYIQALREADAGDYSLLLDYVGAAE